MCTYICGLETTEQILGILDVYQPYWSRDGLRVLREYWSLGNRDIGRSVHAGSTTYRNTNHRCTTDK